MVGRSSYSNTFVVSAYDTHHTLTLEGALFDPTEYCEGSIINNSTEKLTIVARDRLNAFAEYLLKVLTD